MKFVTTDATKWGTGLGTTLAPSDVDDNFWELLSDINNLINNPAQPNSIISITSTGNALTFNMADGSAIGPVYLPVLQFRWRSTWTVSTAYQIMDVFQVVGTGLFMVLESHTSDPATFNPSALGADGAPLYLEMFAFVEGITQLTGDVTAGPGSGSQAATLAASGVTAGSYTNSNITVDAKGRITAASNGSGAGAQTSYTAASKTSAYAILTGDSGTRFNNHGASGSVTLTLPAALAASKLLYGFLVYASQAVVIQTAGSDAIAIGGSNTSGGGNRTSSDPYSYLEIECHVDGQWIATKSVGDWT